MGSTFTFFFIIIGVWCLFGWLGLSLFLFCSSIFIQASIHTEKIDPLNFQCPEQKKKKNKYTKTVCSQTNQDHFLLYSSCLLFFVYTHIYHQSNNVTLYNTHAIFFDGQKKIDRSRTYTKKNPIRLKWLCL